MTNEKFLMSRSLFERKQKIHILGSLAKSPHIINFEFLEASKDGTKLYHAIPRNLDIGFEPELLEVINKWCESKAIELEKEFSEI